MLFQSPLGEVVKETFNYSNNKAVTEALKFQSPLGEVVKETKPHFDYTSSIPRRFNPLSGKW